jgi:hypothetical protein
MCRDFHCEPRLRSTRLPSSDEFPCARRTAGTDSAGRPAIDTPARSNTVGLSASTRRFAASCPRNGRRCSCLPRPKECYERGRSPPLLPGSARSAAEAAGAGESPLFAGRGGEKLFCSDDFERIPALCLLRLEVESGRASAPACNPSLARRLKEIWRRCFRLRILHPTGESTHTPLAVTAAVCARRTTSLGSALNRRRRTLTALIFNSPRSPCCIPMPAMPVSPEQERDILACLSRLGSEAS